MFFLFIFSASLLKGLKHANIVTLHDIIHTRDTLTFVFEYVVSKYYTHGTHSSLSLRKPKMDVTLFIGVHFACFILNASTKVIPDDSD